MLLFRVRLDVFGFVCLTSLLVACSGDLGPRFVPIQSSLPDRGGNDAERIYARLRGLTPGARIIEGMTIANIRCDQFFEKLDEQSDNLNLVSSGLTNLTATLPGILNASGISAKAVANTLATIGFLGAWVNDKKTLFLLKEFKNDVYNNWQQSRDLHFRENIKVALYLNGQADTTGNADQDRLLQSRELADSIVNTALYEYGRLCLRSQLKKYIYDHVKRPITASTPGAPAGQTIITTTTVPGQPTVVPGDQPGSPPVYRDGKPARQGYSRPRKRTVIKRTGPQPPGDAGGGFVWTRPLYGGG